MDNFTRNSGKLKILLYWTDIVRGLGVGIIQVRICCYYMSEDILVVLEQRFLLPIIKLMFFHNSFELPLFKSMLSMQKFRFEFLMRRLTRFL